MRQVLAALALLLASCAAPQTTVRTPDTRPALAFQGAPPGAVLYLDGQRIGDPGDYDGQPRFLVVEPGTHRLVIQRSDGAVVLEETVYLESEHRTVEVH